MNNQIMPTPSAVMNGAPEWLTLPFLLIGLGVVFALFILWRGTLLAKRRGRTRAELEERGEVQHAEAAPAPVVSPAPPIAPSPPPLADAPTPETMPIAAALMPDPLPEHAQQDEAPQPAMLADEPIAPDATIGDDLTRLKGVGARLADRLGALGITEFAQLAAMTPDDAAALDAQLGDFQGRIYRDRWIEQAAFLAVEDVAGYEAVFGKL